MEKNGWKGTCVLKLSRHGLLNILVSFCIWLQLTISPCLPQYLSSRVRVLTPSKSSIIQLWSQFQTRLAKHSQPYSSIGAVTYAPSVLCHLPNHQPFPVFTIFPIQLRFHVLIFKNTFFCLWAKLRQRVKSNIQLEENRMLHYFSPITQLHQL